MADDDYEIVPLKDVKKLKDEIDKLRNDQKNSPVGAIADSLERLTTTLERLFEIFNVAATDIEQEKMNERSFEDKIEPIIRKLSEMEQQNRDIAEGILALADIIKRQSGIGKTKKPMPMPMPRPEIPPVFSEDEMPPMPEPAESEEEIPPPPMPGKPNFMGRFK